MGTINIDTEKLERPYHLITFSDVNCIRGLIKFRSQLDLYYKEEITKDLSIPSQVSPINTEIITIYADLDNLIKKAAFNLKQEFIVNKIMEGYTEKDVAEMFDGDIVKIFNTLNTICNRIKKINDLDWKYNYMYIDHIKINFQYKLCGRCKERLPGTNDFFGKDNRNKDGLKGKCRKCEAIKK